MALPGLLPDVHAFPSNRSNDERHARTRNAGALRRLRTSLQQALRASRSPVRLPLHVRCDYVRCAPPRSTPIRRAQSRACRIVLAARRLALGSYRAILDLEGAFSFLDVGGVLRLLDDRPAMARELFRRHVEADRSKPPAPYKLARMDGVRMDGV